MTITKSIAITGSATLIAVMAVAGISSADNKNTRQDELIDKISTVHNIDKSELEGTFNEFNEEKKAEHQAKREAHLQSQVDNGTISEEQKNALTTKHAEMKEAMHALKDSDISQEEAMQKMKELREEFKSWAENQGINLDELGLNHRGHHNRGMKEGNEYQQ